MTFEQIHQTLRLAGKTVSDVQLHRYMVACKIEACKPLTKPRRYPDSAAATIVEWLGLASPVAINAMAPTDTASNRLASMATLRKERKKARVTK